MKTAGFLTACLAVLIAFGGCKSVPGAAEGAEESGFEEPEAVETAAADDVSRDAAGAQVTEAAAEPEAVDRSTAAVEEEPSGARIAEEAPPEEPAAEAADFTAEAGAVDVVEAAEKPPEPEGVETPATAEPSELEAEPVEEAEEDSAAETEVEAPEEEPLRVPPFSVLKTYLEAQITAPVYMVTKEGEPLVQLEDLDLDGLPEVLVPCVELEIEFEESVDEPAEAELVPETENGEESEVESEEETPPKVDTDRFADFSSLFLKDARPHSFSLYVFRISRTGLTLLLRLNLGYRTVYSGLRRVSIVQEREVPFSLVITFQTRDSEEQEWLFFSEAYYKPTSRLSLQDSYTNTIRADDIDRDGTLDILIEDSGAEEGFGLETFLTWLRWNGREFEEYASTNVVRSLRGFLAQVKERLLARDWSVLLRVAFLPDEVEQLKERGWSDEQILFHAFSLDEVYDTEEVSAEEILSDIKEFFYPDILEDPFLVRDDRGIFFRLTYRIVDGGGASLVSEIPLYMMKNPFGKRQFFLSMPRVEEPLQ